MKPWKTLATSTVPGGSVLTLQQRDVEYAIRVNGQTLMSSRQSGSERAMAEAACVCKPPRRVLIGGLGMGFTLRAVLDVVPMTAQVMVAELSAAVIEWNRGVLGPLAGSPLSDPRVEVVNRDVRKAYKSGPFDAILLDVDNGPVAMTAESNDSIYDDNGLAMAAAALVPHGTLVVWSAGPDQKFVRRLENLGFTASSRSVGRHVLFIAST